MKDKPRRHTSTAGANSAACACPPCRCAAVSSPSGRRRPRRRDRVQEIARAKAAALSPNTLRTYATGWSSYCLWAAGQGIAVSSAGPFDVEGWLVDLAADGKKPSTLRTYRAAVAHRYDEMCGPNPARDPQVRRVLSGLGRRAADKGYVAKQADPLRRHHVEMIADAAFAPRRSQPGGRTETPAQAAQRASVDIAMVAVAHDGLLRSSELTALKWADIDLAEDGRLGLVRIRRSKTDQAANGAYAPISQFASQALNRIKPAHAGPQDRVFGFSAGTLNRRLKAAARHAGIDAANITTHSPRFGMAQDLAASGTDTAGIMLAGRWSTPSMVAHYTRRLTAHHTPAAQHLQTRQPRPPAQRHTHTPPQTAQTT